MAYCLSCNTESPGCGRTQSGAGYGTARRSHAGQCLHPGRRSHASRDSRTPALNRRTTLTQVNGITPSPVTPSTAPLPPAAESALARLDLRTPLNKLWSDLQKPIRLQDSLWLLLNPQAVTVGSMSGSHA